MKATLQFDLPEESYEHRLAVTAMDLAGVLLRLDQQARNDLKYGHNKTAEDVLSWVRSEIGEVSHLINQ